MVESASHVADFSRFALGHRDLALHRSDGPVVESWLRSMGIQGRPRRFTVQFEDQRDAVARVLSERRTFTPPSFAPVSETVAPKTLLPCLGFAPCWLRPGCCAVERKEWPPGIDWRWAPYRIPLATVTLRPFSAPTISGRILSRAENLSKEAVAEEKPVCRCRNPPPPTRKSVPGSATVTSDGFTGFKEKAGLELGEFAEKIRNLLPKFSTETTAAFSKTGYWSTIREIADHLWEDHVMTVTGEIETILSTTHRGQTTKTPFHASMLVVAPVDSMNFDVDWSLW